MRKPTRPSHLSEDAERTLEAIAEAGLGHTISIGGAVASKMVALVERGAPRDFRDVYVLCHSGLMEAGECWRLWRQRQQQAGSDADAHRARLALSTHLSRIAQHRPLEGISDSDQRSEAEALRAWFTTEFLDALVD